jgi:DNA polymerase V
MGGCRVESASPETRSPELIALVDAHCYYVSCHRLFEPRLRGMPVVVLSNNDSAVVTRSDEAKALGVKMSQSRYELDGLVRNHGLILRSSQYALYQDIHRRLIKAIASQVPSVEVYSCDEAFCSMTGMKGDLGEVGALIQRHVLKYVGIPVGVGISRNRTTAKLANWASKKWKRQTGSVVALTEYARLRKLLALAETGDVWGIGGRLSSHLSSYGITTAIQLADSDAKHLRKLHGVGLERTIRELNWEYCIGPEDSESPRQTMTSSRTFPAPLNTFQELSSSIVTLAASLGVKLRRGGLLACAIRVFIEPSSAGRMTLYRKAETICLIAPSNDTRVIIDLCIRSLEGIFTKGSSWIRAGIMIVETIPERHYMPDLFTPEPCPRSRELMATLDQINRVNGKGSVRFGSEQPDIGRLIRRQYLSNRFTTSWSELPEAT